MYKIIVLAILSVGFLYGIVKHLLAGGQKNKPLPENVRDVYDEAEYAKWSAYSRESARAGFIDRSLGFVLMIVLFATNSFALLYDALPGGVYLKSILLMLIYTAVLTVISLPLSYYSEIVIEEKYGFNNSSAKTFIGDQIKGLIINALLNVGLVCLVIWAYGLMGNLMFVIVYAAIALFIIVFSMLSMTFQKIFNKFEPLPEGELRDTLTEMFARAGYKLSDILVMNASLRTKKVNAFCTGLGKFKKIVLYDNLVNNYTNGEIAAVFAHELGHYKHRDTAKLTVYNLFRIMFLVAIIAAVVVVPEISLDFGFAGVNLVFAVLVMTSGVTEPILTLVDIPMAVMSRKFEYRADAMAVSEGYGEDMISALTKLSRDNLSDLNPHPAIVALEYTHPTLSQRIAAVEKLGEGAK